VAVNGSSFTNHVDSKDGHIQLDSLYLMSNTDVRSGNGGGGGAHALFSGWDDKQCYERAPALVPATVEELLEVQVGERGRGVGPGAIEANAGSGAPPHAVSTCTRFDLIGLVVDWLID
jgi:hypothetical protein